MKKIILPTNYKFPTKNHIVISSTLSILRNIDGLVFPKHLTIQEKSNIEKQLLNTIQNIETDPSTYTNYLISDILSDEFMELSSNLKVSPSTLSKIQTIIAQTNGSWVIIPNLTDHIHIYSMGYGLCLKDLYKNISQLLTELDSHIHFSYSSEFGFMTSNINYTGNGLKFSVLLNLSASELKGNISQIIHSCQETGYNLIPLTSHPTCSLFILKNIGSFGISELDHIQHFTQLLDQLQQNELNAKEEILNDQENQELLLSQIEQTLSETHLSHAEASYIIGLIDFLDKRIYKIQDRQMWLEQLFSLKDNSYKFSGLSPEETQQHRSTLLKSLFKQLVTFRRGSNARS